MYNRYGKYFGVFEADLPTLFIADPDMIRSIFVKDFDHFINHMVNNHVVSAVKFNRTCLKRFYVKGLPRAYKVHSKISRHTSRSRMERRALSDQSRLHNGQNKKGRHNHK